MATLGKNVASNMDFFKDLSYFSQYLGQVG